MISAVKTAVRAAIIANAAIADELAVYVGAPAVFTKRPIPDDAGYPCVVVEAHAFADEDALVEMHPLIDVDVCVYGRNDPQGSEYRAVETVGYNLRNLFHRQRWSIEISGASVTDIRARGPLPAPTDDEKTVGRVVTLQLRLTQE
jgi:hypothetical protein